MIKLIKLGTKKMQKFTRWKREWDTYLCGSPKVGYIHGQIAKLRFFIHKKNRYKLKGLPSATMCYHTLRVFPTPHNDYPSIFLCEPKLP